MYRLLFVLAAILLTGVADAVVLKQPDQANRHREMASALPFVPVAEIGGGVAIAPDAILTAGHVARALIPGASVLRIDGADYRVTRVDTPAAFVDDPKQGRIADDLALLRIDGILPSERIAALDCTEPQAGAPVVFVGSGDHEDAKGNPLTNVPPSAVLAGPNTVFAVTSGWIEIAVDAPASPPDAVMSAGGDSGGPLLRRQDGDWAVIGVSSHYAHDGTTEFRRDRFTRVDQHCDFLEEALSLAPAQAPASKAVKAPALAVVHAWLAAYNAGVDEMLGFYNGPMSAIETTDESPGRYRALFDAWGAVDLSGVTSGPEPDSVLIGLDSAKVGGLELVILLTPGDSPRMRGLATFDHD